MRSDSRDVVHRTPRRAPGLLRFDPSRGIFFTQNAGVGWDGGAGVYMQVASSFLLQKTMARGKGAPPKRCKNSLDLIEGSLKIVWRKKDKNIK